MSWLSRAFRRDSKPKQLGSGARELAQQRRDGWVNVITGINTGRDKRSYAEFDVNVVTDLDARNYWLGNDMARRIIEDYPREAFRRGYRLKIASDKKDIDPEEAKQQAEKIMERVKQLRFNQVVKEASMKRRAFGGCAVFPVIDGAQGDLEEPFDLERVTKIIAFHQLEPRELLPMSWYNDLGHPKFGRPETYMVVPIVTGGMPSSQTTQMIHESRMIIFQGIKVSRLHQPGARVGWGDGVLTAIQEVLRDFGLAWSSASALMEDLAQAVLKIKGLANLIATDQDNTARDRLLQIDLLRHAMRAIVIDSEEDFERKSTPLGQVPELLDRFSLRLSAAADMPMTRLMGMSPAGLNATGESDRDFWFDRISSHQEDLDPQVEQGLRLIMNEQEGPCEGVEPEVWSHEWAGLWQPSEKDEAARRYLIAQADDLMINNSTITSEEAAHSHFGGDTYSPDIQIDLKARAQMKALDAKLALQPPQPGMTAPPALPGAKPVPQLEPGQAEAEKQTGDRVNAPNAGGGVQANGANGRRVPVKAHDRSVRGGGG